LWEGAWAFCALSRYNTLQEPTYKPCSEFFMGASLSSYDYYIIAIEINSISSPPSFSSEVREWAESFNPLITWFVLVASCPFPGYILKPPSH
jgi:hypothetical protein